MKLMSTWDARRLEQLCQVAEAAGDAILQIYARPHVPVQHKADRTPVTEADLAADRLIRARVAQRFPGAALLSEESSPAAGADLRQGYFLVDPLDGTREFIARNGEFTVNIAWVCQGRLVAGVVHAPALDETFFGALGLGAFRRKGRGAQGARRTQPIQVTAPRSDGATLRVLASRSHGSEAQRALLARLPPPVHIVAAGSSLKFCRVAEGAADLYPRLSPTMAWDTAAGQAVLQAAGGVVLRADGSALSVPADPCAAPNPGFMAAATQALAMQAWSLARED